MVDWESGEERAGDGLTYHIDFWEAVTSACKRRKDRVL